MTAGPKLPQGSGDIGRWAHNKRLQYAPHPDERALRNFEPFDTMVSPARFYNAVSWMSPPGSATLVEPWTEEGLLEPMDRTVLAFISHPALRGRASARIGEHFITRVSVLTDPPQPKVALGDAYWDKHVITHAMSPAAAQAALTPPLRQLLAQWSFAGHLEMKPGCLVLHYAGCRPTPAGYERLSGLIPPLVNAALNSGRWGSR